MDISGLYGIFMEHPVVTTDSRDCPPGSIFFALRGASFNGNAFAARALSAGCSHAVVDQAECVVGGDGRYILVDDCLAALQALANFHRREMGTRIIGVTGTNGKTTTKELIAAVLSERYSVLCTQGNLNNHIGVPRTLLRLAPEHDIAVVEMGANHPGEIERLAGIVEPDCGIITNVGLAHLAGFGSLEGVARAKGELYDHLRERGGTAFINGGDGRLLGISHGLELVKYGCGDSPDYSVAGRVLSCDPFLNISWRGNGGPWHITRTRMIGSYNVFNMLAAICVGLHFGVGEDQADHAVSSYVPRNNRSELVSTGRNRLIVDAYNANPTSMGAALDNFCDMRVGGKMAIIGDMGELGECSAEEHRKVVARLEAAGLEDVWLVGGEFGKVRSGFRKFRDVEEVKLELRRHAPEGRCILIKGSNSMRLFELRDLL